MIILIGMSDLIANEVMWGGTERIVRKYSSIGMKPTLNSLT